MRAVSEGGAGWTGAGPRATGGLRERGGGASEGFRRVRSFNGGVARIVDLTAPRRPWRLAETHLPVERVRGGEAEESQVRNDTRRQAEAAFDDLGGAAGEEDFGGGQAPGGVFGKDG